MTWRVHKGSAPEVFPSVRKGSAPEVYQHVIKGALKLAFIAVNKFLLLLFKTNKMFYLFSRYFYQAISVLSAYSQKFLTNVL